MARRRSRTPCLSQRQQNRSPPVLYGQRARAWGQRRRDGGIGGGRDGDADHVAASRVSPVNDQTSAAIQPSAVQPSSRFKAAIAAADRCPRPYATSDGTM